MEKNAAPPPKEFLTRLRHAEGLTTMEAPESHACRHARTALDQVIDDALVIYQRHADRAYTGNSICVAAAQQVKLKVVRR